MSTTSTTITLRRPAWYRRGLTIDLRRLRESAPLAALLVVTAALYLWGVSGNGYANEYYAAAVQAGTHSWKAFLFGSLDAANYITVDKPPASLWVMELSGRIFGFSSFSMLLPQALEGVAAVALLYAAIKRWFGRGAGLLSGLLLALTPVAALMFRFNNPDALLVLLLVCAAYALTRALESGSTRWLLLSGAAIGLGFLSKELEAFLVLPAFALTYLVAAPVSLRRRLLQLALAGAAVVISAGWWVALVELWPATARPYLGGSTDNSILQVTFGYNGLGRVSGGSGPANFSGPAGILRLFNDIMGGQIAWLLPAALIALVSGLVWTRRRPRTDRHRAALLLWGGWLVAAGAVFSLMTGTIHPYYTNLLAPPIAVLAGVGAVVLWRHRQQLGARLILAAMLAGTGLIAFVLLDRTPTWHPWLRFVVLIAAMAATVWLTIEGARLSRIAAAGLVAAALVAAVAAPAAYTLSTIATAESGSDAAAGPAQAGAAGFGAHGGAPGSASTNRALAALLERGDSRYAWIAATSTAQTAASVELATGKSVMALGGFTGSDPGITLSRFERLVAQGKIHYYLVGGFGGPGGSGAGGAGAAAALAGRGTSRIGDFPGGGPGGFGPPGAGVAGGSRGVAGGSPPQGRGFPGAGPGGGGQTAIRQIESWVSSHFRSQTVGGTMVYNLGQPKTS